jgi:alpha-N-arabinofuranosidase
MTYRKDFRPLITARGAIDPGAAVGPVPARLFGVLVEHMGRSVYDGIYAPGDPAADSTGLRTDVLELAREYGTTVVRYPGGNFVSGYDWQDGIGAERIPRLDLAWRSIEPNTFGLHEFMSWIDAVGAEPMMAVNLGTKGVSEAVDLIEYTNIAGGTKYSDLRGANGRAEPYGIKLWCLGNEMDGPWQIGHRSAAEYGSLAGQTARAMKLVDSGIELVVCGSSHDRMPTFGPWEETVLDLTYDDVDYISMHRYYEKAGDDRAGYLASSDGMDDFIARVAAICDRVGAAKGSTRKLRLSFDEWNVETREPYIEDQPWTTAPRISEDVHTVEDAVVMGGLLISLLRNSDRVGIACFAQLVNVMAPIRTEPGVPARRQPSFWPFALTARHARGEVLRVVLQSDARVDSTSRGDVAPVDAIATSNGDAVALFAVNRSPDEEVSLELVVPAGLRVSEHVFLGDHGPEASTGHELDGARLRVLLPPASWTMLRLDA